MYETHVLTRVSGLLPDGYLEVLHWRVTERRIQVVGIQILAVLSFVIFGVIFSSLAVSLGKLPSRIEFGLGETVAVLAAILWTVVLHELIHGVVMQGFGAKPRYGILWKKMMFYATAPECAFRRNSYIVVALAPIAVISILSGASGKISYIDGHSVMEAHHGRSEAKAARVECRGNQRNRPAG